VYTTSVRCPWRKVDVDDLRAAIMSARPGCPDLLPDDADVDTLATMYDTELSAVVDRLAPARTVTVRRRSSDPWFDDECRTVKRSVRLAQRLARRCPSVENTADWQSRRRNYRALLRTKRDAFWRDQAEAAYGDGRPRELWSIFDSILGRGRAQSLMPLVRELFAKFSTTELTQSAIRHPTLTRRTFTYTCSVLHSAPR